MQGMNTNTNDKKINALLLANDYLERAFHLRNEAAQIIHTLSFNSEFHLTSALVDAVAVFFLSLITRTPSKKNEISKSIQSMQNMKHLSADIESLWKTVHYLSNLTNSLALIENHNENVGTLLALFGKSMGFSKSECEFLYLAGLLHDIGQVFYPDSMLSQNSQLTKREIRELVELHPEVGAVLLSWYPALHPFIPFSLLHQEWINGEGYPDKNCIISENVQMLSICDVYESLNSKRSFFAREAYTPLQAITLMETMSGTRWDSAIFKIFKEKVVLNNK